MQRTFLLGPGLPLHRCRPGIPKLAKVVRVAADLPRSISICCTAQGIRIAQKRLERARGALHSGQAAAAQPAQPTQVKLSRPWGRDVCIPSALLGNFSVPASSLPLSLCNPQPGYKIAKLPHPQSFANNQRRHLRPATVSSPAAAAGVRRVRIRHRLWIRRQQREPELVQQQQRRKPGIDR